jgi:hypothetical protein
MVMWLEQFTYQALLQTMKDFGQGYLRIQLLLSQQAPLEFSLAGRILTVSLIQFRGNRDRTFSLAEVEAKSW